jgi:hypothetical protein
LKLLLPINFVQLFSKAVVGNRDRFFSEPGMGDDLAVKVRYRLGSRNC